MELVIPLARILFVNLGILCACAFAAAQETYGMVKVQNRNCELTVQVQGYAGPNKKVTGTNESFLIRVSVVKNLPYGGSDNWQNAQLLNVDLKIGGNKCTSKTGPRMHRTRWRRTQKNVRFATTNFYDDLTVNVWLSGTFRLWRLGTASPPNPPPLIEELQLSLEPVVIPLKIYNKGTCLATVIDGYGQPPTPNNPIAEVALEVTDRGKDAMIRHTINPLSGQDNLTKAQVLQNLAPATFFVASTHGSDEGFYDSTHHNGSVGRINWGEVIQIVSNRLLAGIPAYNLVAMYSCDTLANENNPGTAFFSVAPARAYCGFEKKIACAYFETAADFFAGNYLYTTADHATSFSPH